MRIFVLLFMIIFATVFTKLVAQTDAQLSMYWAMPTSFNPAAVAQEDNLHISAINRMQWVGVDNAPNTFVINADMPVKLLKKRHGLGILVVTDKAGLFATNSFYMQYGYGVKLWGGDLTLGVQLGVADQSFDGTKVSIPDSDDHEPSDDAIPTTAESAMGFDAAFGAWYKKGIFYGGISSTHLTSPMLELTESASVKLDRVYYLTAGCNIEMKNPLYTLQPSLLLKSDFLFTQLDLTMRATYNKMFWGGVSYRWQDAVVLLLGVQIKGVSVGYSYDISTSAMAKATSGSHELFASYVMKVNVGPKTKNRTKSIRIL